MYPRSSLEPLRLLRRGSDSELWLARTARAGGRAVLKRPLLPSAVVALEREAALLASLRHPHVLASFGLVADPLAARHAPSQPALVVEPADAGSLADVVARTGPLQPEELAAVLVPVAAALGAIHERGYVHGDVSPANLLYDRARGPLVADLGSAAPVGSAAGPAVAAAWRFAAPELRPGAPLDARCDLYALGATALALLARLPRRSRSGVRAGPLTGVLLRAVQRDPAARHQSMAQLLADLSSSGVVADPDRLRRQVARGGTASLPAAAVPALLTKRFAGEPRLELPLCAGAGSWVSAAGSRLGRALRRRGA